MDVLLALLKDKASLIRFRAASALGQLDQASEVVVDALLALLKDEALVRSRAANALGKLGKVLDATATPNYTMTAIAQWIEQNQESEYVSHGITALWNILSEETR